MTQYYNKKAGFIYKQFKVPHYGFFETKTAEEEAIINEILLMEDTWGKNIITSSGDSAKKHNDDITRFTNIIDELQKENVDLKSKLEAITSSGDSAKKHEGAKENKTK
jgi:hypothetical protein